MTMEYCVIYDDDEGPCDEIYDPRVLKANYENFFRSAHKKFFIEFYLEHSSYKDLVKYYGMKPEYVPKFIDEFEDQKKAFLKFVEDAHLNNSNEILKIEFDRIVMEEYGQQKVFKFNCKMKTKSGEIIEEL